jgi:hypothetical protein
MAGRSGAVPRPLALECRKREKCCHLGRSALPHPSIVIWIARGRTLGSAEEAPNRLADTIELRLRHADEQRQRQALPRIPVCDWEAVGIGHEASQRRLGMQRQWIVQAGFDTRPLHIVAQLVAVLGAHNVEMEHMVVVHNFRQGERQARKSLVISPRELAPTVRPAVE